MRAMQLTAEDGPEALTPVELPTPEPGPGELLLDVRAAGVSFPDVLLSRGRYQLRPPLPFTPGSEVAGVVLQAPPGSGFAPGDRVAAFALLGGFAERAVVPAVNAYLLPDAVDFVHGAALPMNYLTVQFALSRRGRLTAGETVLVHGAAGGVGTAALQWAKWLSAETIAVVSDAGKGETARSAGADHVIGVENFREEARALTDGRGVDLILDPVGGDRFTDSLRTLAPEGRLLVVGFTAGEIPTVRVNRLLLNNLDVVGVAWGAFALGTPGFLAQQWADLDAGIARGALDPPIGAVLPLARAGDALAELEQRRVRGKIVLDLEA
ncbi:MAG: NADPH:quinone reductase [Actinomycetota bacterium]|nr:NADPH:quinone reductase [Actinomycetota bacterium]